MKSSLSLLTGRIPKKVSVRLILSVFFAGLFAFIFSARVAHAATYNIGPGQTYATFRALTNAIILQPDDIVDGGGNTFSVTDSTYWIVNGSGTEGHPIVIQNAIIDGGGIAHWILKTNSNSYITLRNIAVKNAIYYGFQLIGNHLTIQDCSLSIRGSVSASGSHITIENFTASDTHAYGTSLMSLSGSDVTLSHATLATGSVGTGLTSSVTSGLTLDDVEVTGSYSQYGILIGNAISGTVTIRDVYVGVTRSGLSGGGSGYGIAFDSSNIGAFLDADGLYASYNGNQAVMFNRAVFSEGSRVSNFEVNHNTNYGIYVLNSPNIMFESGNADYNNVGMHIDGPATRDIVIDGVSANYNRTDGIDGSDDSEAVVRYSDANYNGTTGTGLTTGSGDGYSIHDTCHWEFYYVRAIGNLNTGMAHVGSSTGVIYNSLILNNGSPDDVTMNRAGLHLTTDATPGFVVRNNIIAGNYPCDFGEKDDSGTHNDIDYNIWHSLNPAHFHRNSGSSGVYMSWDAYHMTHESHSANMDPLLTGISGSDYSLLAGSPAINAGIDVGLTLDYAGNPVPSGALPDIGAYEFQDGNAPSTVANVHGGTYAAPQSVSLACDDGIGVGCDVTYYTLDGTTPTTSSDTCVAPLDITVSATLKFFSIDKNGNVESVKSERYVIDSVAPETTITSGPGSATNGTSVAFSFEADESATLRCKLDDGSYAACTSPKEYADLADGEHTFSVYAMDTAGNDDATPATYTFVVDTAAPVLSDIAPSGTVFPVTTTSATLSVRTDETAECRYAAVSGADFASMTVFGSTGSLEHSTLVTGLETGRSYAYFVQCKDVVNESSEAEIGFSVAPEETSGTIGKIKVKIGRNLNTFRDMVRIALETFTLKGRDESIAGGAVSILKDGKEWKRVSVGADGSWDKSLKLGDGSEKKIKILFYDALGTLLGQRSAKIEVDTEAPIFDNALPETLYLPRNGQVTFTAHDDGADVAYYKVQLLDYRGHVVRKWRKQDDAFYRIPGVLLGSEYSLQIRAYDKAGNHREESVRLVLSGGTEEPVARTGTATAVSDAVNTMSDMGDDSVQKSQEYISTSPKSEGSENPTSYSSSEPVSESSDDSGFVWWNPFTWFY